MPRLHFNLELCVGGELRIYNGFLAFFLGDTPALNWLGGFKETCSKAFKFCRTCDIKHGEVYYNDSKLNLRNIKIHLKRLENMKNASTKKFDALSQKYGINYESFLLKIDFFDVCKCLLQDPMHILYEGICHDELQCFFEYFIKVKKVILLHKYFK